MTQPIVDPLQSEMVLPPRQPEDRRTEAERRELVRPLPARRSHTRRDHGSPETAKARAELVALSKRRRQWLEAIRAGLRLHNARRRATPGVTPSTRYVTADDARRLFEAMPDRPGPEVNRNFLGAVFQARGWVQTGEKIRSTTAGSHGNDLHCWRWQQP